MAGRRSPAFPARLHVDATAPRHPPSYPGAADALRSDAGAATGQGDRVAVCFPRARYRRRQWKLSVLCLAELWSGAPAGSAAYALVVQDMDVKAGNSSEPFTNWQLYNMPRLVTQLSAGVPPRPLLTNGSQQGLNDNQMVGYATPCPKAGDAPHHFMFQLFAQDGYVTLETAAPPPAVRDALNGHTLGEAKLTAIVQR
jgi:Raf kinase inhibitor-like YbhB/YbcL family protein